jgi:hypothetical protein
MRRLAVIGVLLVTASVGAAIARGEVERVENLLVSFNGRFLPHALPRDRDAPITVDLNGHIRTTDGSRPPQLRRISIAVNRYGRLSTEGLPTCSTAQLESTSPGLALARCRGALVGRGRFGAQVELPEASPFPAEGSMLAFNGRSGGKPAVFLHIHGSNPIDITVILTFQIRHRQEGKFGTLFTAKIPRIAADLGYVTDLSLNFGRRYRYRGEPRSFLSARCAAPAGFPGALFSFARGIFLFADGKRITTTLVDDCRVR